MERLIAIFRIVAPTSFQLITKKINMSILLFFVGMCDDITFTGGFGIGSSVSNMTGSCVMIGLALGMVGHLSQAIGAGNIELCGLYMNRARFIITVVMIPYIWMCFRIVAVLEYINIPPEVAKIAYTYLVICIPRQYLLGLVEI